MKNILKTIFYSILVVLSFIYILYRIFFTLPINLGIVALICSIIVLLVEFWDFCDFFVYFLNILCVNPKKTKRPSLKNIAEFPDIDILIATINESESLLENTITACKNLNYPDSSKLHIYLCDDGNRRNIKKLAHNLGINYLSRSTNNNAKAGNYNHALQNISSPFVATFDADMAPCPNFLLETLPYFFGKNKKIGFVQLPQSFVNPDIFQYRFNLEDSIPFEQDYFYHRIQLAKNATNSVVFCGTNALFSREALNATNGFSVGTISEDIATGMMVESKGYIGIALDAVEAYGYAVNDIDGFVKQRSRWARGCIQILKKFKIIRNKGLSFRQKLEYLSCISYWFFGIKRMVYLLAPLLFSILGIIIIDCDLTTFIAIWLPTYILKRFTLDSLEHRKRSSMWNKIYETILTPALFTAAIKEFFGFGSTKFEVSPKTRNLNQKSKYRKKLLFCHSLLWVLNVAGLVMCLLRINSEFYVYLLSLLWTASNIFYLTIAIIFDIKKPKDSKKSFVPNKIKKYSKLSVFKIFTRVFAK